QALEAKADVAEVQSTIGPIVAKETEAESPAESALTVSLQTTLDDAEKTILQVLATGPWTLRSLSGIAKDSQLEKTAVAPLLQRLVEKPLVGRRTGDKGPRWFITEAGRAAHG